MKININTKATIKIPVVTSLKDEESVVTAEDWHALVENVNSKL